MSPISNANPDFVLTIDRSGSRPCQLIYSTLDNLVLAPAGSAMPDAVLVDPEMDLEVYADTVTLHGAITVLGGKIKVVARTLVLPSDQTSVLDVTPDDTKVPAPAPKQFAASAWCTRDRGVIEWTIPQSVFQYENSGDPLPRQIPIATADGNDGVHGVNGQPGSAGAAAATLTLIAGQLVGAPTSLSLRAQGGHGQGGQDGQDGSAGRPPPPEAVVVLIPVSRGGGGFEWQSNNRPDLPKPILPGNGGNGGDGGAGGRGGAGGTITLRMPGSALQGIVCGVDGGAHGADGTPGSRGAAGPAQKLNIDIPVGWAERSFWVVVGPEVLPHGVAGHDGNPPDRSAAGIGPGTGNPGTPDRQEVSDAALGQAFDAIFLQKLLQRARNAYLYAPPDLEASAADREKSPAYSILRWLVTVLQTLQLGSDAESLRKKEVLLQATVLLNNYSKGCSVFGKKASWVPRLSLAAYQAYQARLMAVFPGLEATYTAMLAAAEKAQDVDAHLAASLTQLQEAEAVLAAQIARFIGELPEIITRIEAYSTALATVKVAIQGILELYELELKGYVDCSLAKLFKALEMVAFDVDNVAMAGVQAGELLYGSLAEVNDQGKDYIVATMDQLGDDVKKSMTAQVQQHIDEVGDQVRFVDDKTPLLLTKLQAFEDEMKQFDKAFGDHGAALRSATGDLATILRSRADTLLEYNATAGRIVDLRTQLATLQDKAQTYQETAYRASDPTRTGVVSYFGVLYQNLRDQAMESMYEAGRAFAFWSAGAVPPSSYDSFRLRALWTQGSAPSQFGAAELSAAYTDLLDATKKVQEVFGRPDMGFPSVASQRSNIGLSIDETNGAAKLAEFRASRTMQFDTVVANPEDDQFTIRNTDDKYNVRVWFVRPRLVGAMRKSAGGALVPMGEAELTITHLGRDRLVGADGTAHDFTHDSVKTIFTQNLAAPLGQDDFGTGGDGVFFDPQSAEFASLGVFTRWSIELDEVEANADLDLSQLSAIEIEIGVRAYPR